jgi:pectinesterase
MHPAYKLLTLTLAVFTTGALAQKPSVTVATQGRADYTNVQSAIDAAPDTGSLILITPGTYKEKLHIAKNGIELRGKGSKPELTVLTFDDSARTSGGTRNSGTLTVTGDDFVAENLTIQNDFERTHDRSEEGSQAVALVISGDREVLRHVRLLGYQDTLYANSRTCHDTGDAPCHASRQLYQDCYIEGHIDFIFGDAKAVFDHCEIHGVAHQMVTLTAQSKLVPAEDSGYLFLHSTITTAPGVGKLYYGRPWRARSTVYFVDTVFKGAQLDPGGWLEWGGRLATSDYEEFHSIDEHGKPLDTTNRLAPSKQMAADEAKKLTVKSWLAGDDNWNPEAAK